MKNALKWIKEKYTHRRAIKDSHDPWWVTLMLDVGRPGVAVLILAMSAPGEHFVATLGGYSERLAWGMPGALTAYAGIAAVVATKRPKGAPGRKTAIAGAILSIGIAMGAQPIAHLYGSGAWSVTPTARVWLMVIVSCVPAAVFGHLLHMGAVAPKPEQDRPVKIGPAPDTRPVKTIERDDSLDASRAMKIEPPDTASAVQTIADAYRLPVSLIKGELDSVRPDTPAVQADMISPPVPTLSEPSEITYTDFRTGQPDRTADTIEDKKKATSSTTSVRSIKSASVSVIVREFLSKRPGASDADLAGHVRARKPDAKWDTIRKARDRYRETEETG